jgi:beta-phosphoglucomutase-like phosphatase (HAD superfamily)
MDGKWLVRSMVYQWISLFSVLNGSVSVEDLINAKLEEFHKVQHLIKPIEPVVDIVRKYHGILPMAVGTGGHREAVEKTLEITGLKQYFDVIVTSNDVENYKPHPETFLKCAEKLKVAPRFIEVFEDGEMGIQAARDAGMIATDVRLWYKSDW